MKKLLSILIASVLLLSFSTSAQGGDNKFFQFGIKAGLDFTNMKLQDLQSIQLNDLKSYTGFNAGLAFRFNLPLGFEIQPELLYTQTGVRIEEAFAKGVIKNGTIRIPVNIQWGFRFAKIFKPYVFASPYVGFTAFEKSQITIGSIVKNFNSENLNRFQYGVGVGLGLNIWKFQISAKYNWDINATFSSKIEDTNIELGNMHGAEISLGFFF